jgi:hypothetical protein
LLSINFVIVNQQTTEAAEVGVSRLHYSLAGGRAGAAGLTPAQIAHKTTDAQERGRTTLVLIYCDIVYQKEYSILNVVSHNILPLLEVSFLLITVERVHIMNI